MEVGATSFLFFRLSPSLVVSPFGLHLCIYLCTTDTASYHGTLKLGVLITRPGLLTVARNLGLTQLSMLNSKSRRLLMPIRDELFIYK
jgi:hypothetical protein